MFPGAAFSKSAIKTLASKCEQGSRPLGCSGTMFQRARWPKISMWNRACSGTKFHQPMRFRDVPALNWLPERSSCTESVHSLQNPRCSPCDLANFSFGTMVLEHLGSFFFSGQVLFRNNFSVFDENLGVPEHFIRI